MSNPDSDGDTTGFPYESLPRPAKVKILENLHDPRDKLNILKLNLHDTEWITGWDDASLQFELVEQYYFVFVFKLRKISMKTCFIFNCNVYCTY